MSEARKWLRDGVAFALRFRTEFAQFKVELTMASGEIESTLVTDRTDNSWQEEVVRFLLRSGFRPCDMIGEVKHIANPYSPGRTFGSVWRAMRDLVESEPELAAGEAQDVVCGQDRALTTGSVQ